MALDIRGVILTRLGRFDEAIGNLKEAASDRPTPSMLFHLCRAYRKANRMEDFRHYREQAHRAGISAAKVDSVERMELESLLSH